jgi:hypothetical protein
VSGPLAGVIELMEATVKAGTLRDFPPDPIPWGGAITLSRDALWDVWRFPGVSPVWVTSAVVEVVEVVGKVASVKVSFVEVTVPVSSTACPVARLAPTAAHDVVPLQVIWVRSTSVGTPSATHVVPLEDAGPA